MSPDKVRKRVNDRAAHHADVVSGRLDWSFTHAYAWFSCRPAQHALSSSSALAVLMVSVNQAYRHGGPSVTDKHAGVDCAESP